jgi:tRNA U54 and U55 pseudouridine synthase Pus10
VTETNGYSPGAFGELRQSVRDLEAMCLRRFAAVEAKLDVLMTTAPCQVHRTRLDEIEKTLSLITKQLANEIDLRTNQVSDEVEKLNDHLEATITELKGDISASGQKTRKFVVGFMVGTLILYTTTLTFLWHHMSQVQVHP